MTRLLLAFFVLLSFTACVDDEMTSEPLICENGFIEENGECVCPEGNVTAYNNCLELREDQYYGITTSCPCVDTLIVSIESIGSNPVRQVKINEDIPFTTDHSERIVRNDFFMALFEGETGDSVLVHIADEDFVLLCDVDPDSEDSEKARGVISFAEGGNALDFLFTYVDDEGNEYGTCEFRLEK